VRFLQRILGQWRVPTPQRAKSYLIAIDSNSLSSIIRCGERERERESTGNAFFVMHRRIQSLSSKERERETKIQSRAWRAKLSHKEARNTHTRIHGTRRGIERERERERDESTTERKRRKPRGVDTRYCASLAPFNVARRIDPDETTHPVGEESCR